MTFLLAASSALAQLVYVGLLGFFCLLASLTGHRLPGRLTLRVLPLSKTGRRNMDRQRRLVSRLVRRMGVQVAPAEWRRIGDESERWQASLVGVAFTWMWPIMTGLIGLLWLSWPLLTIPGHRALTLVFSTAILITYGFGYLDYRLTEPGIARAAIFNDAFVVLALCAGGELPRTKRFRTRKQLISLNARNLHSHLEIYAKRGLKYDGSQSDGVRAHVLKVAASVQATMERLHGPDDRQAEQDLTRDVALIMVGLLQDRPGGLLPSDRLDRVPQSSPRREHLVWPVVLIYGATVVAVGACASVLGRIHAAAVISAVTSLLTAVPAILVARWLNKPTLTPPAQP